MDTWLSGGESDQGRDDLFIAVEGGSRVVRGGWLAMVVWIQYFGFRLRGEAIGWSIAGRWSGGSKLILVQWEGRVTRCGVVATSARGDATPRRGKGVDDVSWVDTNLTGSKNEGNACGRFSCFKCMVKIWSNDELIYFLKHMKVRSSFVRL
jgi:hypothetical protein